MDKRLPQEPVDVTVTFLEMAKPPAHVPPLPMGCQIALLKASQMPLHYYRYLQDRVGRKWMWVNALRLDDDELEKRLHAPDRDVRVLYLDGAPAGFFDLKTELPKRVEIAYFGMMDHAMGRGLGRWFLGAAIEAAWSHEPAIVCLQTCTMDHPAALPLYQKLGFTPVSQTHEKLLPLDPEERNAIVMR